MGSCDGRGLGRRGGLRGGARRRLPARRAPPRARATARAVPRRAAGDVPAARAADLGRQHGLRGRRPTLLPAGQTWDDVLATALADGVGILRTALGDDPTAWRWGALHVAAPGIRCRSPTRSGPVASTLPVAMGGEWDTVLCAAHPAGNGFGVTSTSVGSLRVRPRGLGSSAWIVPLGASGDPASPHFADQQRTWAAGELVPMRYSTRSRRAPSRRRGSADVAGAAGARALDPRGRSSSSRSGRPRRRFRVGEARSGEGGLVPVRVVGHVRPVRDVEVGLRVGVVTRRGTERAAGREHSSPRSTARSKCSGHSVGAPSASRIDHVSSNHRPSTAAGGPTSTSSCCIGVGARSWA